MWSRSADTWLGEGRLGYFSDLLPHPDRAHRSAPRPGEREAISLALHMEADLILLDEKKARQMAMSQGLTVSGLLGVLGLAADRGLIPIREVVEALRRTTFRIDPRLLKLLLDRYS